MSSYTDFADSIIPEVKPRGFYVTYKSVTILLTFVAILIVVYYLTKPKPPPQVIGLLLGDSSRATISGPGVIYYSVDGRNWIPTGEENSRGSYQDAAHSQNMWVAVGRDKISKSSDGKIWSNSNFLISYNTYLAAVATDGEVFVAVGDEIEIRKIYVSTNGDDWLASSIQSGHETSGLFDVACNETVWVAVGGGLGSNQISAPLLYSNDLINWVPTNSGFSSITTSGEVIKWNGSYFLCAGLKYQGDIYRGTELIKSTNGIDWTLAYTFPGYFNISDMAWNGSSWIAIGGGVGASKLYKSADGITWTATTNALTNLNLTAIEWNQSRWTISSYDGVFETLNGDDFDFTNYNPLDLYENTVGNTWRGMLIL